MRVQKVDNFSHKVSFCAQKNKKNPISNMSAPMQDGLSTAGAWFGFGVGLDLISRKFPLSKSPTKNSIMTNGIIAGIAGLFTLLHDLWIKHKS